MSRWIGGLLLAGCVLASAASSSRAANPEPLKKLYVVMVFDTDDENLAPSLERDEKRMKALLFATVPGSRYEVVKTLKGKQVTAERIVAAVKALKGKVTADDSILFYYGGHGAINDKYGHVLKMSVGDKDLARSLLRKELENIGAGLTVLLTDCCSTKETHHGGSSEGGVLDRDGKLHPTMKHLFFQARGVVDITAASEEAAWSDDKNGGLFTRSLVKTLTKKPEQLVKEDEAFVTWEKFFPLLQADTQMFFKSWSKAMLARYPDAQIRADTQKPHAFFLGEQLAYAVVEIQNAKATMLKYKYRWEGGEDSAWVDVDLKPGARKTHAIPTKRGAEGEELPRLEIQRAGAERTDLLRAMMWDKDRAPRNVLPFYKIKK